MSLTASCARPLLAYAVTSCVDRYEREEIFYALNVTVKNATLEDSLAQFVKGELLEGDNAYFCEKCGAKVSQCCVKVR